MTEPEAAALLADAGLLTVTSRGQGRTEYRVTPGAECLFPLPPPAEREPDDLPPPWELTQAYLDEHDDPALAPPRRLRLVP
jgi:hypothetical protein